MLTLLRLGGVSVPAPLLAQQQRPTELGWLACGNNTTVVGVVEEQWSVLDGLDEVSAVQEENPGLGNPDLGEGSFGVVVDEPVGEEGEEVEGWSMKGGTKRTYQPSALVRRRRHGELAEQACSAAEGDPVS
jgi:hypothetical protein